MVVYHRSKNFFFDFSLTLPLFLIYATASLIPSQTMLIPTMSQHQTLLLKTHCLQVECLQ